MGNVSRGANIDNPDPNRYKKEGIVVFVGLGGPGRGHPNNIFMPQKFPLPSITFADFPDYYASDMTFSSPRSITEANPWQSEHKRSRRILFEFKNKNGVRLQGTLAIPDDYQPGQKLPMLVNFYEKNSQNLHRYRLRATRRARSSPASCRRRSAGSW